MMTAKELTKDASVEEIQEYLNCYRINLTEKCAEKQMLLVFAYNESGVYKIRFVTATPEEFLHAEYFTICAKSTASRHVKKGSPEVYKLRWTNVKTRKNGQPSFIQKYGMQKEREILPEMKADDFLNGYLNFILENEPEAVAQAIKNMQSSKKQDNAQLGVTVGHYIKSLILEKFGQNDTTDFKSANYNDDLKLNDVPYEIKSCLGKLKDSNGNSWNFGGSSVELTGKE